VSCGSQLVVADGAAPRPLPHLGFGYWLWVASLAAALLAAILGTRAATRRRCIRGRARALTAARD
jgi:hypothetical protein